MPPPPPLTRVVLLGASNLIRASHTVLQLAEQARPGTLDIMAAWGRGRSYGWSSRFVGRTLPGIQECGLWSDLEARPAAPCLALVTDVGNDLLYGAEVEEIAGWVEKCLLRLKKVSARTVLTMLPIKNIENLSERRFEFFRRLLFPTRAVTLTEIADRARRLDARLREIGQRSRASLVEQRAEWYGYDPIHHKLSRWERVWREIFSAWSSPESRVFPLKTSFTRWLRLHAQRPADCHWLGQRQHRPQPCLRWSARSTLSLY